MFWTSYDWYIITDYNQSCESAVPLHDEDFIVKPDFCQEAGHCSSMYAKAFYKIM